MKERKLENVRGIIIWILFLLMAIPIFIMIFSSDKIMMNTYGLTQSGDLFGVIISFALVFVEIIVIIPHIVMSIKLSMGKSTGVVGTVIMTLIILIHYAAEIVSCVLEAVEYGSVGIILMYMYQMLLLIGVVTFIVISIVCIRKNRNKPDNVNETENNYDKLEKILNGEQKASE